MNNISHNMTRAEAFAIASWHADRAEPHFTRSTEECERHDLIAFRIFSMINRGYFD